MHNAKNDPLSKQKNGMKLKMKWMMNGSSKETGGGMLS